MSDIFYGAPCPHGKPPGLCPDCRVKAREDGVAGLVADTPAQRTRLLARMAGNIAGGIASCSKASVCRSEHKIIAGASVAIARAILAELETGP